MIVRTMSVLIETYWNVKFHVSRETLSTSTCINRNILECKESSISPEFSQYCVLIETYWNVKMYSFRLYSNDRPSINRNILECKA